MIVPAEGASDIVARLKSILPSRWFGDATPVLDAVLAGSAAAWVPQFAALGYAQAQTRVATATDLFLDLIAQDFFGATLRRQPGEPDGSFRARLLHELRRDRVTRRALSVAVKEVSGVVPGIFEPARVTDTGAYGAPGVAYGFAYGLAGRWGSDALPFTAFVDATVPSPPAPVRRGPGFGSAAASYGVGTMTYGAPGYSVPPPATGSIAGAITRVLPAAGTAWLRIVNV